MALKEGYIGVTERIAEFRTQHPKGSIETEVKTELHDMGEDGKVLLNTVKATIKDESGKVLATGHDQGEAGNEKELAKTETAAIGRALVNAGYKAIDESAAEEVEKEVREAKKESRFSKTEKSGSRFQKAAKAEEAEEEETEEETTEEESSEASEETEEKAETRKETAAPKEAPKAGGSKVSDLLAKYGKKSNGSALSSMRR